MSPALRRLFDRLLDEEVAKLPAPFAKALEEIPLIVEDEPSAQLLEEMGMGEDEDLCGLHQGVPITERDHAYEGLPTTIHLFRGAIIAQADYPDEDYPQAPGTQADLRHEIRVTLLHEVGHHFGLDEGDLERLGYA